MKCNVLVVELALLLPFLNLASACAPGGEELPAQPTAVPGPLPTPPPSPPAPPTSTRLIGIGETVEDTLIEHGTHKAYEVTASSDGLLVAQLSWNMEQGHLELWLEDAQFFRSSAPIVGTLLVSAGHRYRLRVFDSAPWDYGALFMPFVLTTSME